MDEDLISKKELLELAGISYGQLYRWKRKKLIPEDWFIRKSTFTGQETFFPRDRIMSRIDRIKNMKEDLSLDDLAGVFSSSPAEVLLTREELVERNIVTKTALELLSPRPGDSPMLSFEEILYAYVLDRMLLTGEISLEEGKTLLQAMEDNYKRLGGKNCDLIFIRKMGVSSCLLITVPGEVYFESGVRVVSRLNLAVCIEELKIKIG